jgi:hypothetical protein
MPDNVKTHKNSAFDVPQCPHSERTFQGAESQASERTIMAIAGHVSPKMLNHYSHVRMQTKRQALDALSGKKSARSRIEESAVGHGTKNDTKPKPELGACQRL